MALLDCDTKRPFRLPQDGVCQPTANGQPFRLAPREPTSAEELRASLATGKLSLPVANQETSAPPVEPTRRQLTELASQHGIASSYTGLDGSTHRVSNTTLVKLLRAMGVGATSGAAAVSALDDAGASAASLVEPVRVVRTDEPAPYTVSVRLPVATDSLTCKRVTISDDSGANRQVQPTQVVGRHGQLEITLPPLAHGYHGISLELATDAGESIEAEQYVISAPTTCLKVSDALGDNHAGAGLGVDLYSVVSRGNLGMGDFGDLRTILDFAAEKGLAFVGLPPLHALLSKMGAASPYSPLSRTWLNTTYVDVSKALEEYDCPGAREIHDSPRFQRAAEKLRQKPVIDYAGVAALKSRILDQVHDDLRATAESSNADLWQQYQAFKKERGDALTRFAGFVLMREQVAAGKLDEVPERDSSRAATFTREHAGEIERCCWLQFEAERQLAELAENAESRLPCGLYLDLAVGTAPDGFEPWANPEMFLEGIGTGAPPDHFNENGQNWGFPPFNPRAFERREGCEYYRDFVRANMRHAGILRIDHAFGLRRLFVVPEGQACADGTYLTMPEDIMLAIVALESHRNGTVVIGEDLGVPPPGWGARQTKEGMPGYDVVNVEWLGPGPDGKVVYPRPQDLREEALACVTLHDTPPLRPLIDGPNHKGTRGSAKYVASHIKLRQQLGLTSEEALLDAENARRASVRGFTARLRQEGLLDPHDHPDLPELMMAIARYLGRSSSRLKMWRMSDLGTNPEVKPVNLPGVSDGPDGYPCWMVKADTELADLLAQPETGALLESMIREASASVTRASKPD